MSLQRKFGENIEGTGLATQEFLSFFLFIPSVGQ